MGVLKWLRSEGCPWDAYTSMQAANSGHLDVLQYLHENGCPWNEEVFFVAAEEVQEWLKENNCPGAGDEYYDDYSDEYSRDELDD